MTVRESVLRTLELDYIEFCNTPRTEQSIKRFRLALLKCDCLGARIIDVDTAVAANEVQNAMSP